MPDLQRIAQGLIVETMKKTQEGKHSKPRWMLVSLADRLLRWWLSRTLRRRGTEYHEDDAGNVTIIPNPWTVTPTMQVPVDELWSDIADTHPWSDGVSPRNVAGVFAERRVSSETPVRIMVHARRVSAYIRYHELGSDWPPVLLGSSGGLLDGCHRIIAAVVLGRHFIPGAQIEGGRRAVSPSPRQTSP